MQKVAWIGLGNMGVPMARNLAAGGYPVYAYNRTSRAIDIGRCQMASSLHEAVQGADVVILMVSDTGAVADILFGENGILPTLTPGTLVVNMSTIGVPETKQFALQLADAGFEYMDAPVSGSTTPAEEGTLVILAGGSEAAYNQMKPLFDTMGKISFHLGPVGSGATMKLLVNGFLGLMMETAAECLAVADKSGLGRDTLLEVLKHTAVWAPVLAAKQEMWRQHEYPTAFALKHMAKDLGLMMSYAMTIAAPTPALAAAHGNFLGAEAHGFSEQDMAAISQFVSRMVGNQ